MRSGKTEKAFISTPADLQAIFDAVNFGMLLIGENGEVRLANDTVGRWIGRRCRLDAGAQPGDVLGCIHTFDEHKRCGETSHCPACPLRKSFETVLHSGEPVHCPEAEATLSIRRKRARFWFEIIADPLTIDGKRHVLFAMIEITPHTDIEKTAANCEEGLRRISDPVPEQFKDRVRELRETVVSQLKELVLRHQAEQQLRDANSLLAARAAQLRSLAGEMTLAERRDRRRLASVLHDDLQQLLVAAKFRTTTLGQNADSTKRQAAQDIVGMLDEAIKASRFLTAELSPPILQESRLSVGLEWLARWMGEKYDLRVRTTVKGRPYPVENNVSALLFEAVRELLLNVVKHAQTRSARLHLQREDDKTLRITVSDKGLGFNPDAANEVGSPGPGVGLFRIREMMGMIGGRLQVDSTPGRGSNITLLAPMGRAADGELQSVSHTHIPSAETIPPAPFAVAMKDKIRVLLADDHMVIRQGLAQLLMAEPDIEIVGEAPDGHEAVKLAKKLSPDVVLMDLSMPRLNGIDATRIIHATQPETRVIGLSMFEEHEQAQTMIDAGAVAFLTKSCPAEVLLGAIRRWADELGSGRKDPLNRKPRQPGN